MNKTAFGSCLKTAALCASAGFMATTAAVAVLRIWSGPAAWAVAAAAVLTAIAAAAMFAASLIVVARLRRAKRSECDLFLHLNRSRDEPVLRAAPPARSGWLRRALIRRLLGHDLLVGEEVEVKSWPEIRSTLDERGCLDHLPFMPEMLGMCGRRARVFRSMHRLFDHRKSRRMRHMNGTVLLIDVDCDGSAHGRCEAACHTIWKADWLRRIDPAPAARDSSSQSLDAAAAAPMPSFGTTPPFRCQLTQLHDASQPSDRLTVAEFLRPVVSGNVAPRAFAVGWLTYLFNDLQRLRGGTAFPTFEGVPGEPTKEDEPYVAGTACA